MFKTYSLLIGKSVRQTTMNEFKQDVWLANGWPTQQPNFITQHLSIERCGGHDDYNTNKDDIYAKEGSINGSDYALNIIPSPLMEPEYLEGEFLAEFEKIVRGLQEAREDDTTSESSEDSESYINGVDLEDGTKVMCRPIVLLHRLPDSYIELMTQRLDCDMSVDELSSDKTESDIGTNDEEIEQTDDTVIVIDDIDGQDSEEEVVVLVNDLITEQIGNISNGLFNQEIELYVGDMDDFDGPEITIGDLAPTPTPNILLSESIALTTDTCKLHMYQPKVALARLPKHTVIAFTVNNSCTNSPAKKDVCIPTNDKYILRGHFKLNIFLLLFFLS